MPVEVGRDWLASVRVVAQEGFEARFEAEVKDLDAGIDQGADGVGFASAGWAHQGNVDAHGRRLQRGSWSRRCGHS